MYVPARHLSLLSANRSLFSANTSLYSANWSLLYANLSLFSANGSLLNANRSLFSANRSLLNANGSLVCVNGSSFACACTFMYDLRRWVMSHMNESCLIWMSHVSYEWVMSHMNESCLIWINHVYICTRMTCILETTRHMSGYMGLFSEHMGLFSEHMGLLLEYMGDQSPIICAIPCPHISILMCWVHVPPTPPELIVAPKNKCWARVGEMVP